jgi:hypothetical protein
MGTKGVPALAGRIATARNAKDAKAGRKADRIVGGGAT